MARLPPADERFDSTVALLRDPYRYISSTAQRLGADAFTARLALRRVVCMTGVQAAETFYDERHFVRGGVLPEPVQATVFGRGGVQMLDGTPHRHRKGMFRSIVTSEAIAELTRRADDEWRLAAERWSAHDRVELYDEAKQVLGRAVCAWAGVPIAEPDDRRMARDLAALFEGVTTLGPTHLLARLARRRLEGRLGGVIDDVRAGHRRPPEGSALAIVAGHRDPDGQLLPTRIAAVDLLSVLRPTVAVSVFVVFAALALHRRPEWRERLAAPDAPDAEPFAQEVRRFFRFVPFIAARVRDGFAWQGMDLQRGQLVLLDLHGIDHDPRVWPAPDRFDPDRFRGRPPGPFELVPQGGGADPWSTHRCAGESITVELLKGAAKFLAGGVAYEVPPQDLRTSRSAMPGLPRSRFVIRNARLSV